MNHPTTNPINIAENYKYNIWYEWQKLTKIEQELAKEKLPILLNRSWTTIQNWFYYTKDCDKSAPAEKLYLLSTFFGIEFQAILNHRPESIFLERLKIQNQIKNRVLC